MKSEKPLPQPQTKPEHPIRKLPDIINANQPSADSNDSVVKTIRNKNLPTSFEAGYACKESNDSSSIGRNCDSIGEYSAMYL